MQPAHPLTVFCVGVAAGIVLVCVARYIDTRPRIEYTNPNTPMTLTNVERVSRITKDIPPLDIHLKILSPTDFNGWLDEHEGGHRGVSAITYWDRGQCTILMPSGFAVSATPYHGYATFRTQRTTDDLAHEIFHCASGLWHPDWNVICTTQNAENIAWSDDYLRMSERRSEDNTDEDGEPYFIRGYFSWLRPDQTVIGGN